MSLVIDHVTFAFGRHRALSDVCVRAEAGRIIAVLGPNAAGKSTLLRCIIGALRPNSGSVSIDGEDVHRLRPRAMAQRVGYVPQRAIVSAAFNVRQVVELGRYALPQDPKQVAAALARLDLEEVADRPYRTLSAGQQQRVTMARALAQLAPQGVLVLDEPASAMDLRHVAQLHALLREAAGQGATVVMATHDLSAAAGLADQAWLLDQGRLVAFGETLGVLDVDRLRAVFGVEFAWIHDQHGRPRLLPELPHRRTA
jgi:iron complex transport system ATP-binding protein